MRIATFDELHRSFQGDSRFGSEQQMDVVRHDDKFVKVKDAALAISEQSVQK